MLQTAWGSKVVALFALQICVLFASFAQRRTGDPLLLSISCQTLRLFNMIGSVSAMLGDLPERCLCLFQCWGHDRPWRFMCTTLHLSFDVILDPHRYNNYEHGGFVIQLDDVLGHPTLRRQSQVASVIWSNIMYDVFQHSMACVSSWIEEPNQTQTFFGMNQDSSVSTSSNEGQCNVTQCCCGVCAGSQTESFWRPPTRSWKSWMQWGLSLNTKMQRLTLAGQTRCGRRTRMPQQCWCHTRAKSGWHGWATISLISSLQRVTCLIWIYFWLTLTGDSHLTFVLPFLAAVPTFSSWFSYYYSVTCHLDSIILHLLNSSKIHLLKPCPVWGWGERLNVRFCGLFLVPMEAIITPTWWPDVSSVGDRWKGCTLTWK